MQNCFESFAFVFPSFLFPKVYFGPHWPQLLLFKKLQQKSQRLHAFLRLPIFQSASFFPPFKYMDFGGGGGLFFSQSSVLFSVNYLSKKLLLSVIGTSVWHLAEFGPCMSHYASPSSLFSPKLLVAVCTGARHSWSRTPYLFKKKKRKCSQSLLPQGNVMWWNFCPISPPPAFFPSPFPLCF